MFSFDEIKDSLIKFCDPVTVVGTTKPKNLQKPETCFDEIWSQWDKLHKAKHLPMVVVDSSAFLKLPMVRPGETCSEISSARIAALEAMVTNLINQNKEILAAVDDIKKKQDTPMTYARRVAGTTGGKPQGPGGKSVNNGQNRGRDMAQENLQVPNLNRERSNSAKRARPRESNFEIGSF